MSTNHRLINVIKEMYSSELEIILFDRLDSLPHFNPDIEEAPSEQLLEFKQLLRTADGILICTPEYAHGVPGSLKNAIDWTVSTNEFYHKPTVLITASTEGKFGHTALLETLRVIEATNIEQLNLLIQFVNTKINANSEITDEKTLLEIKQLLGNFILTLNEQVNSKE